MQPPPPSSLVTGSFVPLSKGALDELLLSASRLPQAEVRVSPFCHEFCLLPSKKKELRGWVMDLPSDAPAELLPLPSLSAGLFHGVSVAMCDLPEEEVYRLMVQNAAETRRRLGEALRPLLPSSSDEEEACAPTWKRCRPRNGPEGVPRSLHGATRSSGKAVEIEFAPDAMHQQSYAIIDGAPWRARLSPDGFVGLYFRWCYARDDLDAPARLCLYIACQSYLPAAGRELTQLIRSVRCTTGYACLSEEVQWLRGACARNRARLIALVSERMGLRVATMDDYLAAPDTPVVQRRMAMVCTETLHHDLVYLPRTQVVRVLNYCADTSAARNGSVCVMAPWAPLWVFGGAATSTHYYYDGASFGQPVAMKGRTLVLPTMTAVVSSTYGNNKSLSFVTRRQQTPGVLNVWRVAAAEQEEDAHHHHKKKTRRHRKNKKTTTTLAKPNIIDSTSSSLEEDVRVAYQRALERSMQEDHYYYHHDEHHHHHHDDDEPLSYLVFNEAVLQPMMALFKGQREHNAHRLIPLAVGLTDDVPASV